MKTKTRPLALTMVVGLNTEAGAVAKHWSSKPCSTDLAAWSARSAATSRSSSPEDGMLRGGANA